MQKGMATHSSILAWRIPWTEDSGRVAKSWTSLSDFYFHMYKYLYFPLYSAESGSGPNDTMSTNAISFCEWLLKVIFNYTNSI